MDSLNDSLCLRYYRGAALKGNQLPYNEIPTQELIDHQSQYAVYVASYVVGVLIQLEKRMPDGSTMFTLRYSYQMKNTRLARLLRHWFNYVQYERIAVESLNT